MRGMQGMQGMGMQGMWIGKLGTGTVSRSSGARLSCLGEGWEGFVLGVGAKRKQPLSCSLRSSCHPGRQAQARLQNKALHLQINKNKRAARTQEYFTINLHKTSAVPNVLAAPEPLPSSEQVLGVVGDAPQIPPGLPNPISAPKEAPQVGGSWASSPESQNFSTVQNVVP